MRTLFFLLAFLAGPLFAQGTPVNREPSVTGTQPATPLLGNGRFARLCTTSAQYDVKGCGGAYGDLAFDSSADCSVASGGTAVNCAASRFTLQDVGKTIYVSSGTVVVSAMISGFTSAAVVQISPAASVAVAAGNAIWGHDDTSALQASYNAAIASNRTLYVPTGNYLHHGLNWGGGFGNKITGEGYSSSILYALSVTNPGSTTSAQTTGVDLSGSGYNAVSNMAFFAGAPGFQLLAPMVNVLGARVGSAGASFGIAHVFDSDFFISYGSYNVVLYGFEQASFRDPHFESGGTANLGLLYLSAANTPGFKSPYYSMVAPMTSMTKVSVMGARTAFGGPGKHVVLDQGTSESIYAVSIRDAYINLGNNTNDGAVFISDTGKGPLRDIELDQDYIEAGICRNCQAINIGAPAWQWQVRNFQIYNNGFSTTPFSFKAGILDSDLMIDASGQAVADGLVELSAPSCAGSVIHLGQTQPGATCTDAAAMNDVTGNFATSNASYRQTVAAAGWVKLGTFVGRARGDGPTLTFAEGRGLNNPNSQTTSIVTMRTGNGANAPNLNGISIVSLEPNTGFTGVKAVATGGSASAANMSWDIYVNLSAFSVSSYTVAVPRGAKWIPIDTSAADPGSASSTVVAGNLYSMPVVTATTPAGTCTANGFVSMVVDGVTLHVATCK